jgi:hypothetical protein
MIASAAHAHRKGQLRAAAARDAQRGLRRVKGYERMPVLVAAQPHHEGSLHEASVVAEAMPGESPLVLIRRGTGHALR